MIRLIWLFTLQLDCEGSSILPYSLKKCASDAWSLWCIFVVIILAAQTVKLIIRYLKVGVFHPFTWDREFERQWQSWSVFGAQNWHRLCMQPCKCSVSSSKRRMHQALLPHDTKAWSQPAVPSVYVFTGDLSMAVPNVDSNLVLVGTFKNSCTGNLWLWLIDECLHAGEAHEALYRCNQQKHHRRFNSQLACSPSG